MASTDIPEVPAYEALGRIGCKELRPGMAASGRSSRSNPPIVGVASVRFTPKPAAQMVESNLI